MSYVDTLPTDRDFVRFLTGDTSNVTATEHLVDNEIDAILTEEGNKYLAAALALESMLAKWSALSENVLMEKVGDLSVEYGEDDLGKAVRARVAYLRARGIREKKGTTWALKMV